MKKFLLTLFTTILFFGITTNAAWGNIYSLKAENGRILGPAGFGFNFSGNPAQLSNFRAQASYGIAKYATIGADWRQTSDSQQLFLKASISPYREKGGYTAYAEYYPVGQQLTDCGISFWKDFGWLYAFINLDSFQEVGHNGRETLLTPGVSVGITPKVRLATELAFDPVGWKAKEVRAGLGYKLANRLVSKTTIAQRLDGQKGLTYTTGIALEM